METKNKQIPAGSKVEYDNNDFCQWFNVGDFKIEFAYNTAQSEVNEIKKTCALVLSAPLLLEALEKINGMCADAGKVEDGKINVGHIAKISIEAIKSATE